MTFIRKLISRADDNFVAEIDAAAEAALAEADPPPPERPRHERIGEAVEATLARLVSERAAICERITELQAQVHDIDIAVGGLTCAADFFKTTGVPHASDN